MSEQTPDGRYEPKNPITELVEMLPTDRAQEPPR
jgi:hypothetical protein